MEDYQTQHQPINQIQPPQSPFHRWLPAIVGITIVVLAVGGFSAWQFFQTPEEEVEIPQTTDETASWPTYRNEEFGFEIKYPNYKFALVQAIKTLPPDYKTSYSASKLISADRVNKLGKTECSYGQSGLTSVCKSEKEGGIEFIPTNSSTQSLVSSLSSSLKSTAMVGGEETIKYSIGSGGEGTDYYFVSLAQNKTLVITRVYRDSFAPQEDLFNQILSTFKFTD